MPRHRAGTVCSTPGCPNLTPCPQHQRRSWANVETRRPDALRGRALQQRNAQVIAAHAGRCHICGQPGATKVDHLLAYAEGGTDNPANLAPVHNGCHDSKTRAEAQRGRGKRDRTPEAHPGLR